MIKTILTESMGQHISPTYGKDSRYFSNFVPIKGRGCMLYDKEGTGKLDLLAGLGVNALGHSHPAVTEAINKGAKLLHVSNLYIIQEQVEYADLLAKYFPLENANFFFCNSGGEATGSALKVASKNHGKFLVTMKNSFHGRLGDGNAATGQKAYNSRKDNGERWKTIYPYVIEIDFNNIDDLEKITEDCFAVIYEPVQIEGGVHVADAKYLTELRKKCNEKNIIMISDEVQTGFGRTGKLFASEHYPDTLPDMITLAKAIANGLPMGAVGFGDRGQLYIAGEHASTFGGNPFVCKVAKTVLETIVSENLLSKSTTFQNIFYNYNFGELVIEKRGLGFIYALQLHEDVKPKEDVIDKCFKKGIIIGPCGNNSIRIEPPLIINEKEFKKGLDIIAETLNEL